MLRHPKPPPSKSASWKPKKPPIRVVAPGRVYRPEHRRRHPPLSIPPARSPSSSTRASPWSISAPPSINSPRPTSAATFVQTRFRPSFFPFTEPSGPKSMSSSHFAGGGTRWMEISGCSMVDPNVFKAVNIDPEIYTEAGPSASASNASSCAKAPHCRAAMNEPDIRVLVEKRPALPQTVLASSDNERRTRPHWERRCRAFLLPATVQGITLKA